MSDGQMKMKIREHDTTVIDAEAADGAVGGYKKVERWVVSAYRKIEGGVVAGYKKVESWFVDGFGKVVDQCVEVLFSEEGESVEEAKARLSGK